MPLRRTGSITGTRASRRHPRVRAVLALGSALVLAGLVGGAWPGSVPPRTAAAGPSPSAPASTGDLGATSGLFDEALRIVREHYVDTAALDGEGLVQGSIRGLVDALGDTGHSTYLTPEEVAAERAALDGQLTGIGVVVDTRAGVPVVIAVIDGSPADAAGVRTGDLILAVDGARTDRLSVSQVVERVRGPAGTTVRVRVRHGGGTAEELTMVRERISLPSVSWAFVPGTRIAVIRLVQFSGGAAADVRRAAQEALRRDASAVVLDVRGNPGGLVAEAIGVTGVFLEDGLVYLEQDRSGEQREVRVPGGAVMPDLPMVVLIDYGTASSAEIVAGALQDAGRARIVGERTFGTGTVLSEFELSDGSVIRLGVLQWLTPDGEGIFGKGITPDVAVGLPADGRALDPGEIEDLSARRFLASSDTQLRHAARLLRDR